MTTNIAITIDINVWIAVIQLVLVIMYIALTFFVWRDR